MRGKSSQEDEDEADGAGESCRRVDKWIWCARFVRTREAAADLVRRGHVRLQGRRITRPGHRLVIGDVVTLALSGRTVLVRVVGFAERRGQAEDAQKLFSPYEPEHPGLAGAAKPH